VGPHELGRRLRHMRVTNNWTLRDLAAKTGLSPSFISLIENGRSDISLSRLVRLTAALGLQIADLLADEKGSLVYVGSLAEAPRIRTSERNVLIRLLTVQREQKLEPYLIDLGPHARLRGLLHAGDEFFHVLDGKLRVTFRRGKEVLEEHVIAKNDTVYFPGDLEHSYLNLLDRPARILGASTRQ
jgi:transcriptional regulator with XRE-family HTH domain